METKKPYTILVLMNATQQWLSLSREQRSVYFEKEIMLIFKKVANDVNIQLFDSEYFHAKVSDFMIINTFKLEKYQLLIELLRDTSIYGIPFFEIKDIIIGQENLFQDFDKQIKNDTF